MASNTLSQEKQKKLLSEAEIARRRYSHSLRALSQAGIGYHDRAPEVPQHLLEKCRLIQNRLDMVKLLPKHGIVAEVGVDTGGFSRFILANCQPRHLHLFELDTSRIKRENIANGLNQGIITIHEGDSSSLISVMPDSYFDWVYIDGDHFYEGVKRDIEAATSKVKPGGYLVFNDYSTWSPSSMSRCGVARAVNEFAIANGWEFIFLAFQSMMYNDVALRKPEA